MDFERREFLRKGSLVSASLFSTSILSNCGPNKNLEFNVPKNISVLFQGDSITDGERNRASMGANDYENIGIGYVLLTVAALAGDYPSSHIRYYNRGISGNKVCQLKERWEEDTISLSPDVVSILVGVNDFWHTLTEGYIGTPETYEANLRNLVEKTKKKLPKAQIILGEPFNIMDKSSDNAKEWNTIFPEYQKVAHKISKEFGTAWIPYQSIFNEAIKNAPVGYWTWDGIHPSFAGSYLMSKAWLDTFKSLFE